MLAELLRNVCCAVRQCAVNASRHLVLVGLAGSVLLAGCQAPVVVKRQGDSGPNRIPAGVLSQPDPVPRDEPLSASGNARSYVVFGKRYERLPSSRGFEATGTASWYGRKFHGRQTASGERYDMYTMTAAHKSLPLPTFARVTNLANNRTVIVRVNDRGPFVDDRLIDLSYAAAAKLDMLEAGTARVRVVALSGVPGESVRPSLQSVTAEQPAALPADKPLPYRVPQPIISAGPGATPAQATQPARAPANSQPAAPKPPAEPPAAVLLARADVQYLQIGAFGSFSSADDLRAAVTDTLAAPVFISKQPDSALFRVKVGPFASPGALSNATEQLRLVHQLTPIVVSGSEPKATCC